MTRHQERNQKYAEYRAWLANQPCAVCGARNVQLAHVGIGGTGLKHGDDDKCIPLCSPGCHEEHDNTRGKFMRPIWLSKYTWRAVVAGWGSAQITMLRARFKARNIDLPGSFPF